MVDVITILMKKTDENCYIVIDKESREAAVIDPGFCNANLLKSIEENNISKVKYILLTHGHFDHIIGVKKLKEKTGAKILIHERDAECLTDNDKSLATMAEIELEPCEADIKEKDGDLFRIGKTEFTVMHTPGHSKGSVCYIFENDRIIFTGDTLFCAVCGRTDFYGGSDEELTLSLMRLKSLNGDYTLYPGHYRSTTLDRERRVNRFFRKI